MYINQIEYKRFGSIHLIYEKGGEDFSFIHFIYPYSFVLVPGKTLLYTSKKEMLILYKDISFVN